MRYGYLKYELMLLNELKIKAVFTAMRFYTRNAVAIIASKPPTHKMYCTVHSNAFTHIRLSDNASPKLGIAHVAIRCD